MPERPSEVIFKPCYLLGVQLTRLIRHSMIALFVNYLSQTSSTHDCCAVRLEIQKCSSRMGTVIRPAYGRHSLAERRSWFSFFIYRKFFAPGARLRYDELLLNLVHQRWIMILIPLLLTVWVSLILSFNRWQIFGLNFMIYWVIIRGRICSIFT